MASACSLPCLVSPWLKWKSVNGSDMVITSHHCEHIDLTKSCKGTDCLRVLVQQRYKSMFWLTHPQVMAALLILILWSAHSLTLIHIQAHTPGPFVLSVFSVFPWVVEIMFNVPGSKSNFSTATSLNLNEKWVMKTKHQPHTHRGIVFTKNTKSFFNLPTVPYFCPGFGAHLIIMLTIITGYSPHLNIMTW